MKTSDLFKEGWLPYMGQYEKEFYDIMLKNKKDKRYELNDDHRNIVKHCWPNAGKFHDGKGKIYPENNILAIKVSEEPQ